jgi:dolichyl-phosphate-mannose--protein O-mannosyl transferase
VLGGAAAFSARWRERWKQWFDTTASKAVAILGASWLATMLLWMSGSIVTYWYHYLTSWGFGIMLVGGVASVFDRRYPKEVLLFVVCVLAVAVYMTPVWAEFPISRTTADHLLLRHWR